MMTAGRNTGKWLRRALLLAILITGFAAVHFGWIDTEKIMSAASDWSKHWWLPPLLVLSMAAFFVVALPGSIFFWIIGFLYAPLWATLMVTAGGVLGGIGGYALARSLSPPAVARPDESSGIYRFLQRRSDIYSLCAIRSLPFFPHSVINYTSGMLRIPLSRFIIASIVGIAVKGYVYVSAIRGATAAGTIDDLEEARIIYPLAAIAALLLIGGILHRRWIARHP